MLVNVEYPYQTLVLAVDRVLTFATSSATIDLVYQVDKGLTTHSNIALF